VIRSLIISQQLLGTDEIIVIGHTECGLLNADEDALRDRMAVATGEALDVGFGSFDDLEASIRASVDILRTHPWLNRVPVHGVAFDVGTGRLHPVD
jgi:carbonic anhydrase